MSEPAPSFRITGEQGRGAWARVQERLADRRARGIVQPEEVERVSRETLHTFEGADRASEIFRRCCVTWEVDRLIPITSHRPGIGPVLVAVKRVVRRMLRFQLEPHLSRQRDFNWNLLLLLRELLERERRPS